MIAFHNTSLEAYRRCPQQFFLRREHRADISGKPLERGIAVHSGIEAYLLARKAGESHEEASEKGWASLRTRVDEVSEEGREEAEMFFYSFLDHAVPDPEPGVIWLIEEGFFFGKDWNLMDAIQPFDPASGKTPEEWFGEQGVYYYGRIDFGRIDTRDGVLYVRDFKTRWRIDPESLLKKDAQSRGYMLAVIRFAERLGVTPTRLVLERQFIKPGDSYLQRYTLEPDEIDETRSRLTAEIEAATVDRSFECRPEDERCGMCPVRGYCPAYINAGLLALEPKTAEDCARLYRDRAAMTAKVDDMDRVIRSWLADRGPVPLDAREEVRLVDEVQRPIRKGAVGVLRDDYGMPVSEILNVVSLTKTGLTALLRKYPNMDKDKVEKAVTDERVIQKMKVVPKEV